MKNYFLLMAMAALSANFASCSDDDSNDIIPEDPTKPYITGFVTSAEGRNIEGSTVISTESNTPDVMYDSSVVTFFDRYLEYHYNTGETKREMSSTCLEFYQKNLGYVIADSVIFAADSLSFTADAFFHRTGIEEEIPATVASDNIVDGYPTVVTMSFVHPELGKTTYTFYEEKE